MRKNAHGNKAHRFAAPEVNAHHRAVHSSADAARMAIASYLRELRTDLGWIQKDLARETAKNFRGPSITQETISKMERGTFNGETDKLQRVFKTLRKQHGNVVSRLSSQALDAMCQLYFYAGKVPAPK